MHVCEPANAHSLIVLHELDGNRCEGITNAASEFARRDLCFHLMTATEPALAKKGTFTHETSSPHHYPRWPALPQTWGFQLVNQL